MGKLLTANYKYHLANQLYESLYEFSNTVYYVYLGDCVPNANASISTPEDSVRDVTYDSYRNMLFGKRVTSADAAVMIRNKPYVDGKVYDIYDDTDPNLIDKDYYAVVEQEAYYHVYICLDNNNGAPSTVKPILSYSIPADNFSFRTSDGYLWKHMYLMTDATYRKFATEDYVPSFPNPYVTAVSADGSLYMIKVENGGRGYDNYLTGSLSTQNIEVGGNTLLYQITDSNMSSTNNFYKGCLLYLNEGTGLGQYTTVADSISNSTGNFLVLDNSFTVKPKNDTKYQVYPSVKVTGSGTETVPVVARALVNSQSSNSIYRIDILNRGAGYNYFEAEVIADQTVGIGTDAGKYPAVLRPIWPPAGGHGWEGQSELQTSAVGFVVDFNNTEGNTIPATNGFRSIGIIQDPKFSEITVTLSNTHGTFLPFQSIYKISPKQLISNTNIIVSSSNSLTVNTAANTLVWGGNIQSLAIGSYITGSDNTGVLDTSNVNFITSISSNGEISSNVNILVSNGTANVTILKTSYLDIPMGRITLGSPTLTCATGDFTNQFYPGAYVYLTGSGPTDNQLSSVSSIVNSSVLTLSTNALFSCTQVMIYDAGVSLNGYVVGVPDGATLKLTNVSGVFSVGDKIASIGTGAVGTIDTISRAGVEKGFNTFVQMYKYDVTVSSGSFTENEVVYQGSISNPTATAIIHSSETVGGTTTVYTTNQIGQFTTSSFIYGNTSGTVASINTTYGPELVFGSGHVIYKENVEYVDRADDQTETVRLIFEF